MYPFRLVVGFVVLLLAMACGKNTVEPTQTEFGQAYYPLAVGQTWTYAVDSVVVHPVIGGIAFDTVSLQMQETLVDSFTDASGQLWYRGARSFRADATHSWAFAQTFLLGHSTYGALRREGNLTFVTLPFPPHAGTRWAGNAAFDEFTEVGVGGEVIELFVGWDYRVLSSGEPASAPAPDYPDVVQIEAANFEGLIDRRYVTETYARGVGLIYRALDILHTQCQACCQGNTAQCLDLPWPAKAEKGFYLRQRLLDFQQ